MDASITNLILPILNAVGIPILGMGIAVLYLAYRNTTALYRNSIDDLSKDNSRLRYNLKAAESSYSRNLESLDELHHLLQKQNKAIVALYDRKLALLSADDDNRAFMSDIKNINATIERLELGRLRAIHDKNNLVGTLESTVAERVKDTREELGALMDKISDTKTRYILLRVISPDAGNNAIAEAAPKRGLVVNKEEEPFRLAHKPMHQAVDFGLAEADPEVLNNRVRRREQESEEG